MQSMFRKRAFHERLDCQGFLDWASEVGLTPQILEAHQIERIFYSVANNGAAESHTAAVLSESALGTVTYTQFVSIAKQCVESVENEARHERVTAFKQVPAIFYSSFSNICIVSQTAKSRKAGRPPRHFCRKSQE